MADERDEIRSRIDLVELVGQRVALKRTGKNWKGLCPFHDDRNPSFYVNPDIGYYRCWSCGAKGDVFDWVMKTQNLEFREALQLLAKQAGVELKARPGEATKGESEARVAAMEEALAFFRQELAKSETAKAYCENRGLTAEIRDRWELGYAPDVGEALAAHLQKRKHSLTLCQTLFLVDRDAGGGFYDRFRGRLMFPIRDERGALVAFGGRLLGDGVPKYVNSGDTPIFRKSRVLYGLDRAKAKLNQTRRVVLVEGYLDVIACHQAGVDEAVASLGTAFAEDHARLLKRWCDEATVLYDGDEAGQKAAERASEILQSVGLRAHVACAPAGDDPDTLLRREGPHAVQKAAAATITPLEFSIRRLEARGLPDVEFWREAAAALAASPSPAEVDRHVTELAAKYMKGQTDVGARTTIYAMIKSHRRAQRRTGLPAPTAAAVWTPGGLNAAESIVFQAFIEEGVRRDAYRAIGEEGLLWTEPAVALRDAIRTAFPDEAPRGPARDWIGDLPDLESRARLADIQFAAGLAIGGRRVEDAVTPAALAAAVQTLSKLREERTIRRLKQEGEGDEKLSTIMNRLRDLKKEPV